MSYSDYIKKLKFGSLSDSINAVKQNEMAKANGPLSLQSLGLQGQLNQLQSATSSSDDIDKGIEAGATSIGEVVESMSLMKKLTGIAKGNKSNNSETESETAEQEGEAPVENEGTIAELPEEGSAGSGGASGASDVATGPSELNNVTSTDLAPSTTEVPDSELGSGVMENTEPAGSGEGDIEMQTFSSNQPEDSAAATSADAGTEGAEGATSAAETGDIAAEVGTDAAEVGVETGLETAGAALDGTVVGSIAGVVLQLAGLGLGIYEGVHDATATSQEDSLESQETSVSQQMDEAKSRINNQVFAGGNVMAGLSSTAAKSATSTAF